MDSRKIFQEQVDAVLAGIARQSRPVAEAAHAMPAREEEHRKNILTKLSGWPATKAEVPDRLHVGTAGFFNFDIAAVTRPDYILLLDVNEKQQIFWKEVVELLKQYSTPKDFLKGYWQHFFPNGQTVSRGEDVVPIHGGIALGYFMHAHWMKGDAYQHLHRLALEGHIAAATLDLTEDKERAEALGGMLRDSGLNTDTAYWSNVASFSHPKAPSGEDGRHAPYLSTAADSTVFPHNMVYNSDDFYACNASFPRTAQWNGDEHTPSSELPKFERLLRNVAAIGGATGMHMFTAGINERPLILTHGSPRRTAEQSKARGVLRELSEQRAGKVFLEEDKGGRER